MFTRFFSPPSASTVRSTSSTIRSAHGPKHLSTMASTYLLMQRGRDGFAADLPRLVLLQGDAQAEEELAGFRDGALDVLGSVVE